MISITFCFVSGLISGWLLIARDTVLTPTPHIRAISLIVISSISLFSCSIASLPYHTYCFDRNFQNFAFPPTFYRKTPVKSKQSQNYHKIIKSRPAVCSSRTALFFFLNMYFYSGTQLILLQHQLQRPR